MFLTMRRITKIIALSIFVMVSLQMAKADPIALYTTGVDSNGAKLAAGAIDSNYKLVTSGGTSNLFVTSINPGAWAPNGANSQWISMNANGNAEYPAQGAQYVFRTTFTIGAGFDLSSASISGSLLVDDRVIVRINGVDVTTLPAGNGSGYFPGTLATFTINQGFVLGVNTIDFVIINTTTVTTPVGLQVTSLSGNINRVGTAPIPEPATLLLLGTGLAGVAAKATRRKRKSSADSIE